MAESIDSWAILEIMGHRRLAGKLSQAEVAGVPFLRIDIPSEPPQTQLYPASSVFGITLCSEATARAEVQASVAPAVTHWGNYLESRPIPEVIRALDDDEEHDDDGRDDDDVPY